MKYTVVIEKSDNGYSAYLPDLPGCVAAGDTLAETADLIRNGIVYHLEMLRDNGDPTPEPRATTIQITVEEVPPDLRRSQSRNR